MGIDDLCTEVQIRGLSSAGATKPELQQMLMHAIGLLRSDDTTVADTKVEASAPLHQGLAASIAPVTVPKQLDYYPVLDSTR